MLIFFVMIFRFAGAQPAPARSLPLPPDTMEERVRACAGCHGLAGRGVTNGSYPRLAGKPAGYLYNQLVAFRDGRRRYAPMNYLLAYLPDEYLLKMAQYYAQSHVPFDNPVPPAVSPEVLQHGRNIALNGVPARQVPACMACHGPTLSGREPGIPGLLGLRADYISTQLGGWRYGTRTAIAPDCMQLVAARLTEADVAAVAAWLASQAATPDTRPLPRSSEQLPLACGSQK
ncbi:c-type cytochrome [Herbaspirillum sp. HC18]|nr:c-type cytochrome [Herbaspirillum sp. HC18]